MTRIIPAKSESAAETSPLTLWYPAPAAAWVEALPIGNGRLGGMVFGGAATERIALNESTLWSGGPQSGAAPCVAALMPELRRAVLARDFARAEQIARQQQGPWSQAYMPLGDLMICFPGVTNELRDYQRRLDLDRAVQITSYSAGGITYRREVFASAADQAIIVRLTCNQPGKLSFRCELKTQLGFATAGADGSDTLILTGKAPSNALPKYHGGRLTYAADRSGEGMNFDVRVKAIAPSGQVAVDAEQIVVEGADAVTLILVAATSYNGSTHSPGLDGAVPAQKAQRHLASAAMRSYEALLQRHLADYQALFHRVKLDLGGGGTSSLPTSQRVAQWREHRDPQLVTLLFQYGRYLLISSSRPGGTAANLQGIWNDLTAPPWSSNYTTNINVEMNYWPAETTNLAECHEPLLRHIGALAESGAQTARNVYGARGWVVHHNSDLWGASWAVGAGEGRMEWSPWPMAAAWLADHLWQHYAFNPDLLFLRETAYPLMKGAAEFCLDLLVDDGHGHLVTVPSTSPENVFIDDAGQKHALTAGATMDMALLRELFEHTSDAADALGVDQDLSRQLRQARAKLLHYQIAVDGTLAEWADPTYRSSDPGHRHVSHLVGVYPLADVRFEHSELISAVKRSLDVRGDDSTGWSMAWKLNLWARLRDGERCHKLLDYLFRLVPADAGMDKPGGVYLNLFGAHPPFQIDSNLGFTAGITETLLQSHDGTIRLLPALPAAWPNGSVQGLRARGGFVVDIVWAEGKLLYADITSNAGLPCRVVCREKEATHSLEKGQTFRFVY